MTYYKIVRINDDGLRMSLNAYGELKTEYPVNLWVQAPAIMRRHHHYLLVYDNLHDANVIYKKLNDWYHPVRFELWECSVRDTMKPTYFVFNISDWHRNNFRKPNGRESPGSDWDKGTVMAKRVKLTRKVI